MIFAICLQAGWAQADEDWQRLQITREKTRIEFTMEVADTPAEWASGLMHRESLPKRHGMLFLFPGTRQVSFWMKDTPLSLDLLFADACGRILEIAPRAVPLSTNPIRPVQPVKAVLEIAGGSAESLGIIPGDRLLHASLTCQ